MAERVRLTEDERRAILNADNWYHSIDLGDGVVTPGSYDHRPYLHHYHFPESLAGKTVLDIGAASGYFSFELERRGGKVTATDLPNFSEHDFGPTYQPEQHAGDAQRYLNEPFDVAKRALGSQVERKRLNIYDISPDTVGVHDLVFCGSLLIHLTDPVRALWNVYSVTGERAIIATVIVPDLPEFPSARFTGFPRADTWWAPNRAAFEQMVAAAGFAGIEWVCDFRMDYRNGTIGPYHGVIHAYKTTGDWGPNVIPSNQLVARQQERLRVALEPVAGLSAEELRRENVQLRSLVAGYERGRVMRLMRRVNELRARRR